MAEPPAGPAYPVIFIDRVHVKIRGGQVANRPIYMALAVTCDGMREILGLWAGDGGEGAKYWMHVLAEIKNRGVADACMVMCDGLKALPQGHRGALAGGGDRGLRGPLSGVCDYAESGPARAGGVRIDRKDLGITASWFGFRCVWISRSVRIGAVDGYTDL